MDQHSEKSQTLLVKPKAFVEQHIYPNEEAYAEHLDGVFLAGWRKAVNA